MMLAAPIPATEKALTRSGLGLDEIGAFEVNEAFASVALAWLADIGADEKLLNPNAGRSLSATPSAAQAPES
jgi:acetyl-CoA acyltransferase